MSCQDVKSNEFLFLIRHKCNDEFDVIKTRSEHGQGLNLHKFLVI